MSGWVIVGVAAAIVVFSVVPGIWLYWPKRTDPVCRSDLGIALMAGAFVAFAVLGLQLMVESRLQRVEDLRQEAEERQNLELQLVLTTEPLPRISLRDRDLSYFYLYKKVFPQGIFNGANLTGANLTEAVLTRAHFNGSILERAHLDGAAMAGAKLLGATLRGANLTNAQMPGAELDGAKLQATDLTNANLRSAYLPGVTTRGSSVRTNMTQTDLTNADLTGADLSNVYFEGPTLTGAKFNSDTVWPAPWEDRWKCDVGKTCTITEKGPIL
jgi:uncharacterized protein YjbI with pentapeptide repeats